MDEENEVKCCDEEEATSSAASEDEDDEFVETKSSSGSGSEDFDEDWESEEEEIAHSHLPGTSSQFARAKRRRKTGREAGKKTVKLVRDDGDERNYIDRIRFNNKKIRFGFFGKK